MQCTIYYFQIQNLADFNTKIYFMINWVAEFDVNQLFRANI